MRGLYWQPRTVTRIQRSVIALFAIVILIGVERFPREERQPYFEIKMRAAQKAEEAMNVIRDVAVQKRLMMKPELDPANSGMIGPVISPITSGSGSLISKQTTMNPNFAAVAVQWLKEADVKPGDLVAVGVSGSFPAVNVAVYSAIREIGAKALIVSSVAASQFGANNPSLTWIDMEAALREQKVLPYKSIAASRGGVGDDAIGLSSKGRKLLDRAIERNELRQIGVPDEQDEASQRAQLLQDATGELADDESTDEEAVDPRIKKKKRVDESGVAQRMRIYREKAGERNIKAFVNVGGGTVSVGTKVGKKTFRVGVNRKYPKALGDIPSVMGEFVKAGVPAIHFTHMVSIAREFGLPLAPMEQPPIGEGGVFQRRAPNRWLAGLGFLAILLALLLAGRPPWVARMAGAGATPQSK